MNLPQFPSSFSCTTGEEEVEKPGIKISLEKGESFGEGVFKFCFIFSFLIILLSFFVTKLIFCKKSLVCLWESLVVSPCPHLNLSLSFFPLSCPDEEGSDKAALVDGCPTARDNSPQLCRMRTRMSTAYRLSCLYCLGLLAWSPWTSVSLPSALLLVSSCSCFCFWAATAPTSLHLSFLQATTFLVFLFPSLSLQHFSCAQGHCGPAFGKCSEMLCECRARMIQEQSWHTGVGACSRPTETSEDVAVIFRISLKTMNKAKYFSYSWFRHTGADSTQRQHKTSFSCCYRLLINSEGNAYSIKREMLERCFNIGVQDRASLTVKTGLYPLSWTWVRQWECNLFHRAEIQDGQEHPRLCSSPITSHHLQVLLLGMPDPLGIKLQFWESSLCHTCHLPLFQGTAALQAVLLPYPQKRIQHGS